MKAALKKILLGTSISLALGSALQAAPLSPQPQSARIRCFAHYKTQELRGFFAPHEKNEMLHWTTRCTSRFSATVLGTWLVAHLEQFEDGRWRRLDAGHHVSGELGPGTYRVIVENDSDARTLYVFTHSGGIG
jgi:hypothetical protein